MRNEIQLLINWLREQLWFRPFIFCMLSIGAALIASIADGSALQEYVPEIKTESIEDLLSTLSSSMLVISIFTVASMLSAFTAASNTATPRSFRLIVRDDVSQNALSAFIGSFIFSIVASVALQNGYYGKVGHFLLFLFTILLFMLVILTFLRWVNRISRLGRLEHTIKQVESATERAIRQRIEHPTLSGVPLELPTEQAEPIYADKIGYVQHILMESLQGLAESSRTIIRLNCLPGTFIQPGIPIAYVAPHPKESMGLLAQKIRKAISIGKTRHFDQDPRFGLITLSEIGSRALSPGINDPGTAIQILGSYTRLLALWHTYGQEVNPSPPACNRVQVPTLAVKDLFEDTFRPIARDGASNIEVMIRLQKALQALSILPDAEMKAAANIHSKMAWERAEVALTYENDLKVLREACLFTQEP